MLSELQFSMAELAFALVRLRILYHTRPRWKERMREVYILSPAKREKWRFCRRVSRIFHANDEKLYRVQVKSARRRTRSLTGRMRVDKLAYMTPPYESEIRLRLSECLALALGETIDSARVHMPAREAHASFRPPHGADLSALVALDFGTLYGAPFIERVRVVNGWFLFDFSSAFFSALVERICDELPAPTQEEETHEQNRMRVLERHGGSGCPDDPAFTRALLFALTAHKSRAAYHKAEQAAEALFHKIPPRDREKLITTCGAFGGAMLRLLGASR
jgi:hypothetical protein